jgi:hypothetical protein
MDMDGKLNWEFLSLGPNLLSGDSIEKPYVDLLRFTQFSKFDITVRL